MTEGESSVGRRVRNLQSSRVYSQVESLSESDHVRQRSNQMVGILAAQQCPWSQKPRTVGRGRLENSSHARASSTLVLSFATRSVAFPPVAGPRSSTNVVRLSLSTAKFIVNKQRENAGFSLRFRTRECGFQRFVNLDFGED